MSSQGFVQAVALASRGGAARSGPPEGEQDSRGAFTGRSCAHAGVNSTQVLRGTGSWFHKGQERHPHRPHLFGQAEELSRDAFLGPRLLCIDGWG